MVSIVVAKQSSPSEPSSCGGVQILLRVAVVGGDPIFFSARTGWLAWKREKCDCVNSFVSY